ncbi:hypothetical protein FRB99_007263 [Tulasnella sp. 403]|nr:hypothetical protein FRB99_007263 [Tulasnella sp. 403]
MSQTKPIIIEDDEDDIEFMFSIPAKRKEQKVPTSGQNRVVKSSRNSFVKNPEMLRRPIAGPSRPTRSATYPTPEPTPGPSSRPNSSILLEQSKRKRVSPKTNHRKRPRHEGIVRFCLKLDVDFLLTLIAYNKITIDVDSDVEADTDEIQCLVSPPKLQAQPTASRPVNEERYKNPQPRDSPLDPKSDEEWDFYHAGFVWPPVSLTVEEDMPLPQPQFKEIDFVALQLSKLVLPSDEIQDCVRIYPLPHGASPRERRLWSVHAQTRYASTSQARQQKLLHDSERLALKTSFRRSSGAIMSISQSGKNVAIASAAIGGMSGPWDADLRACNVPGALILWNQDRPSEISIPQQLFDLDIDTAGESACHFRDDQEITFRLQDDWVTQLIRVYYTVIDVKFDPLQSHRFVSCSQDYTLQSWQIGEKDKTARSPLDGPRFKYPAAPTMLEYKPGTSILSVGCTDGATYLHTPGLDHFSEWGVQKLRLPGPRNLSVNSLAWGPQHTGVSDLLVVGGGPPPQLDASSSSTRQGIVRSYRLRPEKAEAWFDFVTGKTSRLCCHSLAMDPLGQRLAIVSNGALDRCGFDYIVEYFDMRTPPKAVFWQDLPPFRDEGEVLSSSFSPDGIYFACARDDNRAHIWDSRFMKHNAEPLMTLAHGDPPVGSAHERYGIATMTWNTVDGSSSLPYLVTGGDDGKIIRWDMRNGKSRVLAELETTVGHFTLGDPYKGEMPLIAGDCDAKLYVYDHASQLERQLR